MAFVSDVEETIRGVNETIDNMPSGVWAFFVEKMYLPFVKRLIQADLKKILPVAWMGSLPTYRPPKSMRQNYFDLCAILLSDRNIQGPVCRELIQKMQKPAYCLIYALFKRDCDKEEFRILFMSLNTQIQMINGQYSTYFFVKNHLRDYDTVDFLISYVIKCGGGEFILQSIRGYSIAQGNVYTPRMKPLQGLICGLETHIRNQEGRRLALAMALQNRLGAAAGLGALGTDLLSAMAPTDPPKLIYWHDVLAEFVGLNQE
jgi:hypothetical protein